MQAKFIGDPREGPERDVPKTFDSYGVTFERGKWADVPDHLAQKFVGNSHFETKGAAPKAPEIKTVAQPLSVPVIPPAGPSA